MITQEPPSTLTAIFRTLFEDSQDGMYVSTASGRFIDVNKSLCLMLGYSRDELLAQDVESTYELSQERRRFIYEIETNGSVRNFHVRLKGGNGTIHHCSIDAVVWRTESRQTGGYVGTIKHRSVNGAATAFSFDDERFTLALRGSNDGLWEWDIRHKRVHFSQRWKTLIGYGNSEIGESMDEWFSRIHPADLQRFREALTRYLKRETPVFSCYHRLRHRDGHYLWMMGRGMAEYMDSGGVLRIAGSLTDVSGHISTIEQFKAQENQLSKRNERLERDRDLLSRYFPPELVQQICETNDTALKGTLTPAAVIYLKIKDAATLIDTLNPERFANFLNDFTTDILDLVYSHQGSVNRVLGDSILITFGCPVTTGHDLEDATKCALDIREYLKVFNDVRPEGMAQALELSMGMAYGNVFAASIGSVRRMEYTILGSAIGNAQALMELCVSTEFDILVGPEVFVLMNGSATIRETRLPGAYTLHAEPERERD